MSHLLDAEQNATEHVTVWWTRVLDSSFIQPAGPRTSEKFWLYVILAVLGLPLGLWGLVDGVVQGQMPKETVYLLLLGVPSAFNARITYLRILLALREINDVSWYDMPSLVRHAESQEQRWLAGWRRATVGKLVARVALLVIIGAILIHHFSPPPFL